MAEEQLDRLKAALADRYANQKTNIGADVVMKTQKVLAERTLYAY